MLQQKTRRILIGALLGVAIVYAAALAATYHKMCGSPGSFASFVDGTPTPLMRVVPFKPLWMRARRGDVEVGDPAPDFDLETSDHSERVRLSQFRGDRPVVLVFGSYT